MVQYYLLDTDINPGASAEVDSRDLPRQGTTKALIFDITAQQSSITAATRTAVDGQIDQIRIGAEESNRISEIDGEDLSAYNALLGNHTLFDSAATDNTRIVSGYTYGFDPFMTAPQIDYNQPFGITGKVARKVEVSFAADGGNIDDKRVAIGIVVDNNASNGYVTFHRDSYTAASGSTNWTDVPQPGKFLGVLNFETNGASDITTDGDHRTTQDIKEQAITINRRDVMGPIYTTTMAAMNGSYEIGSIQDEGYSLWNLGIHNKAGGLGLPKASRIPNDMEIRSVGGNTGAVRTYAITLNDNV